MVRNRRRFGLAATVTLSALVMALSLAPIASAGVDGADFLVWRWNAPGPRGMGMIDDRSSSPEMFVEMIGLEPALTYKVVASERGCNRNHRSVDQVFSRQTTADGNGTAYMNVSMNGGSSLVAIESMRLFRGSTQVDCGQPLSYQVGGNPDNRPHEQMSLNIFSGTGGAFGMVQAQGAEGQDTLRMVLSGLDPNTDYRLIGKGPFCADPPKPGKEVFRHSFTSSQNGTAYSASISKSFNCVPDSVTLIEIGQGTVATVEGIIMANTEGDF